MLVSSGAEAGASVAGDLAGQPQGPRPLPPMSPEAARRAAGLRNISAMLGDIVGLLIHSPHNRHYAIADLEWLVIPAIVAGQVQMVEGLDPATGNRQPLAVALWANLSDDLDRHMRANLGKPHRLNPADWTSGSNSWLMLAAGEPRAMARLFETINQTRFKQTQLWIEQRAASGATVLTTLGELVMHAARADEQQESKAPAQSP